MTTFTPLPQNDLKPTASGQLTSLWVASHVNRLVQQVSNSAKTTYDSSGQRWRDSFVRLTADGWWEKTSPTLSLFPVERLWAEYSETWPKSGWMSRGVAGEQVTSARPTSASESSLLDEGWRTPTARDHHPSGGTGLPGQQVQLAHQVAGISTKGQWPTPRAHEHWQGEKTTQATMDAMEEGRSGAWVGAHRGETLTTRVVALGRQEVAAEQGARVQQALGALTDWPTPTSQNAKHGAATDWEREHRPGHGDVLAGAQWPTPRASDGEKGGPNQKHGDGSPTLSSLAAQWPTPSATDHKGSSKEGQRRGQLSEAAEVLWPTPRQPKYGHYPDGHVSTTGQTEDGRKLSVALEDAVANWATPKSTPSGPDYARTGPAGSGGDDLATQVARGSTGQLNPSFVELLQCFPIGWTDPTIPNEALAPWPGWPARPGAAQFEFEPPRVAHKIPNRVKRLKALGNAVVSAQAQPIFEAIMAIEAAS